jgi:hypothetical protein
MKPNECRSVIFSRDRGFSAYVFGVFEPPLPKERPKTQEIK